MLRQEKIFGRYWLVALDMLHANFHSAIPLCDRVAAASFGDVRKAHKEPRIQDEVMEDESQESKA